MSGIVIRKQDVRKGKETCVSVKIVTSTNRFNVPNYSRVTVCQRQRPRKIKWIYSNRNLCWYLSLCRGNTFTQFCVHISDGVRQCKRTIKSLLTFIGKVTVFFYVKKCVKCIATLPLTHSVKNFKSTADQKNDDFGGMCK